jgi:hypothetical protein
LLTILNRSEDSLKDGAGIALAALTWVLSDTPRAERFLALTGLTPDTLRASIDQPETHRAVLDFLCAHEPDLIAAAEALDMSPAALAELRGRIAS